MITQKGLLLNDCGSALMNLTSKQRKISPLPNGIRVEASGEQGWDSQYASSLVRFLWLPVNMQAMCFMSVFWKVHLAECATPPRVHSPSKVWKTIQMYCASCSPTANPNLFWFHRLQLWVVAHLSLALLLINVKVLAGGGRSGWGRSCRKQITRDKGWALTEVKSIVLQTTRDKMQHRNLWMNWALCCRRPFLRCHLPCRLSLGSQDTIDDNCSTTRSS